MKIIDVFKEILSIMSLIFFVVVFILYFGFAIIFDYVKQDDKNDKYSDQILTDKWRRKQ